MDNEEVMECRLNASDYLKRFDATLERVEQDIKSLREFAEAIQGIAQILGDEAGKREIERS